MTRYRSRSGEYQPRRRQSPHRPRPDTRRRWTTTAGLARLSKAWSPRIPRWTTTAITWPLVCNEIGMLLGQGGRTEEAVESYRRARAARALARAHPAVIEYRRGLAHTLHQMGLAYVHGDRPGDAVEPLRVPRALREAGARPSGGSSTIARPGRGTQRPRHRAGRTRAATPRRWTPSGRRSSISAWPTSGRRRPAPTRGSSPTTTRGSRERSWPWAGARRPSPHAAGPRASRGVGARPSRG